MYESLFARNYFFRKVIFSAAIGDRGRILCVYSFEKKNKARILINLFELDSGRKGGDIGLFIKLVLKVL